MRRCESISLHVIEQAHQETLFRGSRSFSRCLQIGLKLQLYLVPQLLLDNRRVLAGVGCSLVGDLTQVNLVVQDQIESATRIANTSRCSSCTAHSLLAADASFFQVRLDRKSVV